MAHRALSIKLAATGAVLLAATLALGLGVANGGDPAPVLTAAAGR